MLTVTDQQPTAEQPVLLQSDVKLEFAPVDGASALPLSLLVGPAPKRGDASQQR